MIRLDVYQWIREQIGKGKFWSFSHVVDVSLISLGDSENRRREPFFMVAQGMAEKNRYLNRSDNTGCRRKNHGVQQELTT